MTIPDSQNITIEIDQVDLATEHEGQVYNDAFLARLKDAGFSMTGGLMVFVSMRRGEDPIGFDFSYVARNLNPDAGEPNSMAESLEPRFLKFMAFRRNTSGSPNWSADILNMIIAENGGEIPDAWMSEAFRDIETNTRQS